MTSIAGSYPPRKPRFSNFSGVMSPLSMRHAKYALENSRHWLLLFLFA